MKFKVINKAGQAVIRVQVNTAKFIAIRMES